MTFCMLLKNKIFLGEIFFTLVIFKQYAFNLLLEVIQRIRNLSCSLLFEISSYKFLIYQSCLENHVQVSKNLLIFQNYSLTTVKEQTCEVN